VSGQGETLMVSTLGGRDHYNCVLTILPAKPSNFLFVSTSLVMLITPFASLSRPHYFLSNPFLNKTKKCYQATIKQIKVHKINAIDASKGSLSTFSALPSSNDQAN